MGGELASGLEDAKDAAPPPGPEATEVAGPDPVGPDPVDSETEPIEQIPLSSFYYLLSSLRVDWPYSLSPGSLSTNINKGHTSWDTEIWMFPCM
jgi:hypothetical protein